jgi:hypothetical protein
METCCLKTNRQKQVSVPLDPINLSTNADENGRLTPTLTTTLNHFSLFFESNLDWKHTNIGTSGDPIPPVAFRLSEDATLLQCEKPVISQEEKRFTMFGIYENQSLYSSINFKDEEYEMKTDDDLKVIVEGYKLASTGEQQMGCQCTHPHFDWTRTARKPKASQGFGTTSITNHDSVSACTANARIKIIDLCGMQNERRKNCKPHSGEYTSLDSPGSICHLLRSILKCGDGKYPASMHGGHCASPWRDSCVRVKKNLEGDSSIRQETLSEECDKVDQVIGILLRNQIDEADVAFSKSRIMNDSSFWDELEETEIRELQSFRTSDAVPSYYLYSSSGMKGSFSFDSSQTPMDDIPKNGFTLIVYRHLPSRPQFKLTLDSAVDNNGIDELCKGCLWETAKVSTEMDGKGPKQRMVAPPYQDINDLYGNLLKTLCLEENMKILIEEARKIPQWTAWPEKTHYQSEYDESDNIDSAYPASWTVFPLCHTFPASDVSKRQFVPLTCGYVPKTTELLKSLGPQLRTALFSRLEPRTTLGAHNGWSDLANHVLRVHIPLSVPHGHGHDGLCGTWVDGCVETHKSGRIISFDDSKTHRAFNYSDEERIVLIVDLARPNKDFPVGTSTGGHTDELDKFINQFAG